MEVPACVALLCRVQIQSINQPIDAALEVARTARCHCAARCRTWADACCQLWLRVREPGAAYVYDSGWSKFGDRQREDTRARERVSTPGSL